MEKDKYGWYRVYPLRELFLGFGFERHELDLVASGFAEAIDKSISFLENLEDDQAKKMFPEQAYFAWKINKKCLMPMNVKFLRETRPDEPLDPVYRFPPQPNRN